MAHPSVRAGEAFSLSDQSSARPVQKRQSSDALWNFVNVVANNGAPYNSTAATLACWSLLAREAIIARESGVDVTTRVFLSAVLSCACLPIDAALQVHPNQRFVS